MHVPRPHKVPSGVLVWLHKMTSAERRKMTVFQGIFRSEGTPEGRGQQQHQYPRVAAARSHKNAYLTRLSRIEIATRHAVTD